MARSACVSGWGDSEFMVTDEAKRQFWQIFTSYSSTRSKEDLTSQRIDGGFRSAVNLPSDAHRHSCAAAATSDRRGRRARARYPVPVSVSATPWRMVGLAPRRAHRRGARRARPQCRGRAALFYAWRYDDVKPHAQTACRCAHRRLLLGRCLAPRDQAARRSGCRCDQGGEHGLRRRDPAERPVRRRPSQVNRSGYFADQHQQAQLRDQHEDRRRAGGRGRWWRRPMSSPKIHARCDGPVRPRPGGRP